ncbi:hypothetical protein [Brevibacterium linens]|uniref:Uncharacterized protein n=1 Tax=Brevibacterium linens TaxID=1703 RepID=A0A0B9AP14_BRELN|nr:hypothetical protein [Brevibacterium linens]KHS52562.1 hypothetical protein AE0388_1545 [Brevibacterium linens]
MVDKTGWDPAKCQATSKKRGDQCKNYPVRGLRVCLRHGGGSKKARAAATRNLEQEKFTRVARRLGTPHENLDPAQALLDLVASKAGEVEWLRHQVELLETDGDLWWGATKVVGKDNPEFGEQYERTEEARQHVVYTLLHKAQDQLARYAAETLKAGVDERQVKLAEQTGAQFETVLTSLLTAISATPEQMQTAATEIPRILRNLAGGGK